MLSKIQNLYQNISSLHSISYYGEIASITGLIIEIKGLEHLVSVYDECFICTHDHQFIPCEIISLSRNSSMAMAYYSLQGVGIGCHVLYQRQKGIIYPDLSWKGRTVDAFANPIDEKLHLLKGTTPYYIRASPPPAFKRKLVEDKLELGIKVINNFLTCCQGQRMGIFAGSGVGKTTLLSMLTRHCQADIIILGLIGERGKELQDFLQKNLTQEDKEKSIIIASTSDQSALMRRRAAYTTLTIAEYFRDQGLNVLCMIDSVTRFAMAEREIGLAIGEPPTTKGYTPSVFSALPTLLERAGPGTSNQGSITGLFTVLVENDDFNEPITDAVRGTIDGHIILSRSIAEKGRFPAVDVLKSVSRALPDCHTEEDNILIQKARAFISTYENMKELIQIGAYEKGTDEKIDKAISFHEKIESFFSQKKEEFFSIQEGFDTLKEILKSVHA